MCMFESLVSFQIMEDLENVSGQQDNDEDEIESGGLGTRPEDIRSGGKGEEQVAEMLVKDQETREQVEVVIIEEQPDDASRLGCKRANNDALVDEPIVKKSKEDYMVHGTMDDFKYFIKKEEKDFKLLGAKSSFSIYKKPMTAHQHFCNLMLAKDRQGGQASEKAREDIQDRVMNKWKDFKAKDEFPVQELSEVLHDVLKMIPRTGKQSSLKDMFQKMQSSKGVEGMKDVGKKRIQVGSNDNIVKRKVPEKEEVHEEHSNIKELGKALSTEPLEETAKELKKDISMTVACSGALAHVQKFRKLSSTYKKVKSWAWKNSTFTKVLDESHEALKVLKDVLNTGEVIRSKAKEDCQNAGLVEMAEISSKAKDSAKENDIKVFKALLDVKTKLKEANSQLGKRFAKQNLRKKPDEMKK